MVTFYYWFLLIVQTIHCANITIILAILFKFEKQMCLSLWFSFKMFLGVWYICYFDELEKFFTLQSYILSTRVGFTANLSRSKRISGSFHKFKIWITNPVVSDTVLFVRNLLFVRFCFLSDNFAFCPTLLLFVRCFLSVLLFVR